MFIICNKTSENRNRKGIGIEDVEENKNRKRIKRMKMNIEEEGYRNEYEVRVLRERQENREYKRTRMKKRDR